MTSDFAADGTEAAIGTSVTIHATAVAIGESGVLIRGPSGCGKSSLAMDLVFAARRMRRFASLVGDDRIDLDCRDGRIIARGHKKILGMVEKRGLGILKVPHEPAVVARLVVDLVAPHQAVRFPDPDRSHVALCGVELPVLALLQGMSSYDCAVAVLSYLERGGTI